MFDAPAARNLALCVADSEKMSTPVEITADYAYFRLRDEGYSRPTSSGGPATIAALTAACRDVFVYFKHEEEGKGPEFAAAAESLRWRRRASALTCTLAARELHDRALSAQ